MKKFLAMFLMALSATAAFAQDEGDEMPAGTRTAAFVVVQAADGGRSVYKIPAEAVAAGRDAVVAAATPENRIQANLVADEGDVDTTRPAWFWCWNTFSFGWGGYNWYSPVYSWSAYSYSYWVYRWYW